MELTNIQFLKIKDKLCHAVPYCNKCPIMKFKDIPMNVEVGVGYVYGEAS